MTELVPLFTTLALLAKRLNIGFTVDAEEADRLDLSLGIIEAVCGDPQLEDWEGFGLALQAFQKRAYRFGADRSISHGVELSDYHRIQALSDVIAQAAAHPLEARPLIGGTASAGKGRPVYSPADRERQIVTVCEATSEQVIAALDRAQRAAGDWDETPAAERAACLERMADAMEAGTATLTPICCREGGQERSRRDCRGAGSRGLLPFTGTGYGLTFGIHSRIDKTVQYVLRRVRAGNAYVNRNIIGAVVGVQLFGGEGLSGTGPKAGGPHYLQRFASERTVSIDTTAAGGKATLMTLEEGILYGVLLEGRHTHPNDSLNSA